MNIDGLPASFTLRTPLGDIDVWTEQDEIVSETRGQSVSLPGFKRLCCDQGTIRINANTGDFMVRINGLDFDIPRTEIVNDDD